MGKINSIFLLLFLLTAFSIGIYAGEYEDTIATIVTYIDGTYNSPIANLEASKKLLDIVNNKKLTTEQKIKKLKKAYKRAWVDTQIPSRACYADGLLSFGRRYITGSGVPKDFVEGIMWYQTAADAGSAKAQLDLYFCYKEGIGVDADEKEAITWLNKAVELGYAPAQSELAWRYLAGEGVMLDAEKAVELLKLAVAQDDARGQYMLGTYYLILANAPGSDESNKTKGLELLKKSADQGFEQAIKEYNDYVTGEL